MGLIKELRRLLRPCATASVNTVRTTAAKHWAFTSSIADDRLCKWCDDASNHATIVLCDHCNACYHPHCTEDFDAMKVHGGPWFCHACKGFLVLWEAPDVMQDWPLMDYLWTGTLLRDLDECDQLIKLGETYRAQDNKLQVLLPAAGHRKECWVNVPPLRCCA